MGHRSDREGSSPGPRPLDSATVRGRRAPTLPNLSRGEAETTSSVVPPFIFLSVFHFRALARSLEAAAIDFAGAFKKTRAVLRCGGGERG